MTDVDVNALADAADDVRDYLEANPGATPPELQNLLKSLGQVAPTNKLPPKLEFFWYLTEKFSRSEIEEELENKLEADPPAALIEAIQNAFYEVEFACTFDTHTGTLTMKMTKGDSDG